MGTATSQNTNPFCCEVKSEPQSRSSLLDTPTSGADNLWKQNTSESTSHHAWIARVCPQPGTDPPLESQKHFPAPAPIRGQQPSSWQDGRGLCCAESLPCVATPTPAPGRTGEAGAFLLERGGVDAATTPSRAPKALSRQPSADSASRSQQAHRFVASPTRAVAFVASASTAGWSSGHDSALRRAIRAVARRHGLELPHGGDMSELMALRARGQRLPGPYDRGCVRMSILVPGRRGDGGGKEQEGRLPGRPFGRQAGRQIDAQIG